MVSGTARSRRSPSRCALCLCVVGAAAWLVLPGSNVFTAGRRGLLGAAAATAAGGAHVARAEDLMATFTVNLNGDAGGKERITVRLRPDWAPRGVQRFQELVRMGEMKNSAVFHVDEDTAHFGLPAEPSLVPAKIKDDLVRSSNRRGTLAFASSGQNGRVNQLFFNTDDNKFLDSKGYAPIGEVVSNMEAVDNLYEGYGKKPKRDEILLSGNAYLDKEFPKLSKIVNVEIEG